MPRTLSLLVRTALAGAALFAAAPVTLSAQAQAGGSPQFVAATSAAEPAESFWDGTRLFAGLDGSKQPQDLGINANMGVRVSADMGLAVSRRHGLGLQAGLAANLSDAAVHVLDQLEGTSRRTQAFATVGLFQRLGNGVNWTLGYDLLTQSYYDRVDLGQLRGSAGIALSATNEVGAWFTRPVHGDDATMGETAVRLDPIGQLNGYLTHTWPTSARTTVWAGVAGGHHNVVWVLPDNSRDRHVLVYGAQLELPLSDRVSVSGAANFLTPTATGTVDAFLGLTFHPGGKLRGSRATRLPVQAVANNPTFPVNMYRR